MLYEEWSIDMDPRRIKTTVQRGIQRRSGNRVPERQKISPQ